MPLSSGNPGARKPAPILRPTNPAVAGRVVAIAALVLRILGLGDNSKIRAAIVELVEIDVVYLAGITSLEPEDLTMHRPVAFTPHGVAFGIDPPPMPHQASAVNEIHCRVVATTIFGVEV